MRAYRKRPWASLIVNMTPLIDVIFLIIIFFIMMINFSEVSIRKVLLPNADTARTISDKKANRIPITIKSEDIIYLYRNKISLHAVESLLKRISSEPENITVLLRGDEDLHYEVIQNVMEQIARAGITSIEFAARKKEVLPFGKESAHATAQ